MAWRDLARAAGLRAGFALNLAVWFTVQTALVLTAFLCATLAVRDGPVLLTLQAATILSAGATSAAARRWSVAPVMVAASLCWCVGAGLWLIAAPFPAAALLGIGLGAGTVLSWSEVARQVGRLGREEGARVEARAYAALTAMRDLVSAVVPAAIGLSLSGAPFGTGRGSALLLLLVTAGSTIVIAFTLRSAARQERA